MRMWLPVWIGLRYVLAKRENHFISFISMISVVGLILGISVLILVLSIMNGFDRELRNTVLNTIPHVVVFPRFKQWDTWQDDISRFQSHEQIVAVSPYIEIDGLLTYQKNIEGAKVLAIQPEMESELSIIDEFIEDASLNVLQDKYRIVLGYYLAKSLGVQKGEYVTLSIPQVSVSLAGAAPRFKRFQVAAIFASGSELDTMTAYIHLRDGQKLTRKVDQIDGVRLKTTDIFSSRLIARTIAQEVGNGFYLKDWTFTHGSLYEAIQLEKNMIGLLLFMIVGVAAFNIVSTLVMVVTDKEAEVAILRTQGMPPGSIMMIFMVQGILISTVGAFVGSVLGILLANKAPEWIKFCEDTFGVKFLDVDVYFIEYLPSQLIVSDVIWVVSLSIGLSLLATIYPSYKASKLQPAEVLRYE